MTLLVSIGGTRRNMTPPRVVFFVLQFDKVGFPGSFFIGHDALHNLRSTPLLTPWRILRGLSFSCVDAYAEFLFFSAPTQVILPLLWRELGRASLQPVPKIYASP